MLQGEGGSSKKAWIISIGMFSDTSLGWPLELMAFAYLVVSPPSMSRQFEEIAAAASNKTTSRDIKYPEIEEEALQFILDSCESSISKYSKFLQASGEMDLDVTNPKQLNRRVFLKQLAVDLCTSERRILYRSQYILRRRLRDIRSRGEGSEII
ncbi:hypothetical protein HAX54_026304 [Datura stramonium]|uniref:Rubisco LSMT substrate-binding domain-containing protein n=1 Tax=Datura stramonium TaxID=4076 RepID=A0ABS8V0X3_DATST|nr:hypothetical protein [Datura stramonium]